MSRNNILIAIGLLAVLALGGVGYYFYQRQSEDTASAPAMPETASAAPGLPGAAPEAAAKGPLPDPVFLVVDRQAVLRFSKAGQDITRQMQPLIKTAQTTIVGERASLERQAADLQKDTSLPQAERDKRFAALEARQQSLQADATRRQQQLAEAMQRANAPLSKAVAEILPAIVKERGANIVLDRGAIAQADPAFDVTGEVIKQLDARLPSVPVSMSAPLAPAGK